MSKKFESKKQEIKHEQLENISGGVQDGVNRDFTPIPGDTSHPNDESKNLERDRLRPAPFPESPL